MCGAALAIQPFTMRVNRLGLVPVSCSHPGVRRYRLARLEEVAEGGVKAFPDTRHPTPFTQSPEPSPARTPPRPTER